MRSRRYLYRFGYQTDKEQGTECKRSQCVWIIAENEQAAIQWGRAVSDHYVAARWPTCPNWGKSKFSHWIEICYADVIGWTKINAPSCAVGEFPAWPAEPES